MRPLLTAMLLLVGCGSDEHDLVVDVRTDLAPGIELASVRARLVDPALEASLDATPELPFADGVRVGEWPGLAGGSYELVVDALDGAGSVIVTRTVLVELRQTLSVTVLISRGCRDVVCPDGGDPAQTTCAAGRCVDPRCSDVDPESCGAPLCVEDTECASPVACVAGSCVEGGCFEVPDDALCGPGESCDAVDGCLGPGVIRGGSYTGDGQPRTVSTGAPPIAVWVKAASGAPRDAVLRTATMPGTTSKPMGDLASLDMRAITSLDADGFGLGASPLVNEDGVTYTWVAFFDAPGVAVGEYVASGSPMAVTGVGLQPTWLFVAGEDNGLVVADFAPASGNTFRLTPSAGVPNGVESFDTDGFSIGMRPFVNTADVRYHYLAFGDAADVSSGTYVGDASAMQAVTGVGFVPSMVVVRADGNDGAHYHSTWSAFGTLPFFEAGPVTNGIVAFDMDSFGVGDAPALNRAGITYHWLAVRQGR